MAFTDRHYKGAGEGEYVHFFAMKQHVCFVIRDKDTFPQL